MIVKLGWMMSGIIISTIGYGTKIWVLKPLVANAKAEVERIQSNTVACTC